MAILTSDIDKPHRAESWQATMADSIRDPAELCRRLKLDQSLLDRQAADDFPLLVPEPYLRRIRHGSPQSPLLAQVMPLAAENSSPEGFQRDPLGEVEAAACPGLLSKYAGRSLIVTTGACAVHCRYCFRRHFPSQNVPRSDSDWDRIIGEINSNETTSEVILSGGDPLTMSDGRLEGLFTRLAKIPHVGRLRIHTRMPVMIPQRVTGRLLGILRGTRLATVIVVQINHPEEIDEEVAASLGRLIDAGIPVLNQSVLLRGVNDRIETLFQLLDRLSHLRVMPYYLHQLDPVSGAAHFQVDREKGTLFIERLREMMPGYAVPRYVECLPGALGCQTAFVSSYF